jgi:hypothetical protein
VSTTAITVDACGFHRFPREIRLNPLGRPLIAQVVGVIGGTERLQNHVRLRIRDFRQLLQLSDRFRDGDAFFQTHAVRPDTFLLTLDRPDEVFDLPPDSAVVVGVHPDENLIGGERGIGRLSKRKGRGGNQGDSDQDRTQRQSREAGLHKRIDSLPGGTYRDAPKLGGAMHFLVRGLRIIAQEQTAEEDAPRREREKLCLQTRHTG